MQSLTDRPRYQTDFGVSWALLPTLLLGALLAAGGVAWAFKFAFVHGWYLIFLLPAVGGLALGGALYWLVGKAHCRNHWLAGAVGGTAGLLAFLGYYHLCLIDFLPPGQAWRVDLLPQYISFRLQTDVAEEVGRANVGQQPKKPFMGLNWYTFSAELLMMGCFAAGLAWNRARRGYCAELGQWMQRDVALFPPYSS